MTRVAHDVFHALFCSASSDADSPDVSPGEVFVDEKFSLTTPLAVRKTVCIEPVPTLHNTEIDFTEIFESIEKSQGLCDGVTVSKDKLESLLCNVLSTADKIYNFVLVFRLSGYVSVLISKQHG